ncbi:hypothetical protein [Phenylobacterium sp.]|nr:hypothetical protein [Phenylobacterium sp.]
MLRRLFRSLGLCGGGLYSTDLEQYLAAQRSQIGSRILRDVATASAR